MDHTYPRLQLLQESFPWLASLATEAAFKMTHRKLGEVGSQLFLTAEEVHHLHVSQKRLLEDSDQIKLALSQVENVISVSVAGISDDSTYSYCGRRKLDRLGSLNVSSLNILT